MRYDLWIICVPTLTDVISFDFWHLNFSFCHRVIYSLFSLLSIESLNGSPNERLHFRSSLCSPFFHLCICTSWAASHFPSGRLHTTLWWECEHWTLNNGIAFYGIVYPNDVLYTLRTSYTNWPERKSMNKCKMPPYFRELIGFDVFSFCFVFSLVFVSPSSANYSYFIYFIFAFFSVSLLHGIVFSFFFFVSCFRSICLFRIQKQMGQRHRHADRQTYKCNDWWQFGSSWTYEWPLAALNCDFRFAQRESRCSCAAANVENEKEYTFSSKILNQREKDEAREGEKPRSKVEHKRPNLFLNVSTK